MYDSGLNNEFEKAHQKGLHRGFDLGWSYKGKFDRQIIQDKIIELEKKYEARKSKKTLNEINILRTVLTQIKDHKCNRENITLNFW
jgi:thymidylate synthase